MTKTRGSVTIELAILAPSILLLAGFAMLVGRISLAAAAVDGATYSGARAASLARDASTAKSRAEHSIETTLQAQDVHCLNLFVDVDTSQFRRAVGEPASVTVVVECRVDLSAGAFPGMERDHWVSARYSSPLDQFRGRSG